MSDFVNEVNEEVKRRIEIIESPDYEFIPAMKKSDKIAIIVLCVILTISLIIVYNVWV